ncbi:MAG: penicillin-binding transpeptidase domain-containing protein [Streptococcus sp.]
MGGWKTGVSPVELAGAYATIANNGNYIESHTINYVEVVETNKTVKLMKNCKNVTQSIGEDVSFMIRETMLSYSSSTTEVIHH